MEKAIIKMLVCLSFILSLVFTCFNLSEAMSESTSTNIINSCTKITATSEFSTSFDAAKAIDNNVNTRWNAAPGCSTAQALELDFGSLKSINRIVIKEYLDRITDYLIEYYGYDEKWHKLTSGYTIGASKTDRFQTVLTQKIKINIKSTKYDSNGWGKEPTISEIQAYCDGNLSIGAIATASSEFSSSYSASMARDGNSVCTRWNSAPGKGSGEWLQLDFGIKKSFRTVVIKEYLDRISEFELQAYDDYNCRWYPILLGSSYALKSSMTLDTVVTQKIRLKIISTKYDSFGWGMEPSILEFEVYYDTNFALYGTATSSSTLSSNNRASLANDGNTYNTQWHAAANKGAGEWLEIDFGRSMRITHVQITEYLDRIIGHKIQCYIDSNNDRTPDTWVNVYSGTSISNGKKMSLFCDGSWISASKIRLYITNTKYDSCRNIGFEPSIYEFEVYGYPGDY